MELIGESGIQYIECTIWILLVLAIINDIVSIKYRRFANACFYIRILIMFLKRLIPNTKAMKDDKWDFLIYSVLYFQCLYTGYVG